jgi:hypothetical protein
VVQGLSVQARDGATRVDLEAVITCAMAAWDTLVNTDRLSSQLNLRKNAYGADKAKPGQ